MITLEKAMKIVKDKDAFYYKDEVCKGKKFRIFNYRLATYSDFADDTDALELRGLTFDLETGNFYLGLHKFFNDGENPFAMIEWDKDDILDVREKLDGSLIQTFFIKGVLFVKTKGTFKSEQALAAEDFILNNDNYFNFIYDYSKRGYHIFFEYVSPFNQVVIPYNKTDLVLTQIRDKNGNYLDYEELKNIAKEHNLSVAKEYNYTLEELRKLQKTEKGIEGWVVRNKKYPLETQFRKIKTEDYHLKHSLLTGNAMQENIIVGSIIKENIDDIISTLQEGTEKRNYLEEVRNKVSHHYDKTIKELIKLLSFKNSMERKEFALQYKRHPYFGTLMKSKDENDLEKNLKEAILKRTQKLKDAKEFLKNI